jgi:Cyanate lyase C-terminal domain
MKYTSLRAILVLHVVKFLVHISDIFSGIFNHTALAIKSFHEPQRGHRKNYHRQSVQGHQVGSRGQKIKELIHEEFCDDIMSAIDFSMDIQRQADPKGDRVNVVL